MRRPVLILSIAALATVAGSLGYLAGRYHDDWACWDQPHLAATLDASKAVKQAPPGETISPDRERALKAPVEQLARESFAKVAPEFVEIVRPSFTGMAGPGAPLWGLTFATRASSAGEPGLCKASVAYVHFHGQGEDDDAPVTVRTVYKAVGPLKPLNDMWNVKYGAELAEKCKHAGRVLPANSMDLGQNDFFDVRVDDDVQPWFAVRAAELALLKFRSNPLQVRCIEREPADGFVGSCVAAILPSSAIKLENLISLDMTKCDSGPKGCYDVTGSFIRSAHFNARNEWELKFKAFVSDPTATGEVGAIRDIAITSSTTTFD